MPPKLRSIGRVSVVIPTLNEAQRLPALLAALAREPDLVETIVADGGSSDGTGDIAERLGALVISAERGRGCQLRAGAAAASGEILLFLHADSVFPSGGLSAIAAALDRDATIPGGNFRVVFDIDTPFTRRLAAIYAWIRRFALYYGDSGIFVRRQARPLAHHTWFDATYARSLGITDRRKVLHSTRHNFKEAGRRAGIEEAIHDPFAGHTNGSVGRGYGGGPRDYPVKLLAENMAKIGYPGLVPTIAER